MLLMHKILIPGPAIILIGNNIYCNVARSRVHCFLHKPLYSYCRGCHIALLTQTLMLYLLLWCCILLKQHWWDMEMMNLFHSIEEKLIYQWNYFHEASMLTWNSLYGQLYWWNKTGLHTGSYKYRGRCIWNYSWSQDSAPPTHVNYCTCPIHHNACNWLRI